MTDAQVASNSVQAVRRRKYIRLIRYLRVSRAVLDQSTSSGFAIGQDGSIILDNDKIIRDGGSTTSSSQSPLAAATSTTSDQPYRQTIQATSTIPSGTPFTDDLSLPQTSPPVPSPSPTTILMSNSLPPTPVKLITEVPAQLSQFSAGTFTSPDIVFITTTFSPSRSPSTVVATATATQNDLPITIITSTSAFVHPVTITTLVPSSGTDSQLSTTIVTLTTDSARSTARGAGKAITNAGSGTAALPSGLPSSNPEYGLKVSHNPPLIIGLILGSILFLSACAAGAGWILRARRRWQDHRIAALGIDTRTSFGNASALFVPDPTWYRDGSKESDGATKHGGGIDTRRASVNLEAESSQRKGNAAGTGVGTFYGAAKGPFVDSSAPQRDNTNQFSYNYPSAMKYAHIPDPAQQDHPVPISVVLSQTRSRNAPLSLSLPLALSAAGRFSKRGTFAAGSRLPTPAFGERNRGELSGGRSESIMKHAYQPSTFGLGYSVDPPITSGRQDLERMAEIASIARVGTVDQNYEMGRGNPLRVVGGLPGVATADGSGSDAGASTGSRVEEKLKRMREKRKELEKV